MSIRGKYVPVQAGTSCLSAGIPGSDSEVWLVLYSCPLLSLLVGVCEGNIFWSTNNSVLCVYDRYALGLRNDNHRTCDGLKNHAPMLSTLQPACDEWCIINPDPLPVERLKKQERSFLIRASSGLKPPSCLGSYINQNLGLAIFYK